MHASKNPFQRPRKMNFVVVANVSSNFLPPSRLFPPPRPAALAATPPAHHLSPPAHYLPTLRIASPLPQAEPPLLPDHCYQPPPLEMVAIGAPKIQNSKLHHLDHHHRRRRPLRRPLSPPPTPRRHTRERQRELAIEIAYVVYFRSLISFQATYHGRLVIKIKITIKLRPLGSCLRGT